MAAALELNTEKWVAAIKRLSPSMPRYDFVCEQLIGWLDERRFSREVTDFPNRAAFCSTLSITDAPFLDGGRKDRSD